MSVEIEIRGRFQIEVRWVWEDSSASKERGPADSDVQRESWGLCQLACVGSVPTTTHFGISLIEMDSSKREKSEIDVEMW